ncbi:hypothetical protein WJX72_011430 [[Myrmecia] bisecta]|uniref:Cytochrome b5 heme-binding domain-containing protein n=1 Tax=[Myrmecia] bisecta TaxID=41462 RepID=A0AAW1Q4P0_9CHLO
MSLELTLDQLKAFDGSKPEGTIYISVKGVIYDVTSGSDFYGPGSGYHIFAGKEASRALALMSLKQEDCTGNLEGLTEAQLETLASWEAKFALKYQVVGRLLQVDAEGRAVWDYSSAAC